MARNNTDSNADDPLLAAFRLFYEAMMAAVPAATPGLPGADGPTVTPWPRPPCSTNWSSCSNSIPWACGGLAVDVAARWSKTRAT